MRKDQVTDGNIKITYTIDFSNRKNLYIIIKNREVIVRAPRNTSIEYIRKVVMEKKNWILKKQAVSNLITEPIHQYKEDEEFYILGKLYRLRITFNTIKKVMVEMEDSILQVTLPVEYKEKEYSVVIKNTLNKFYKKIAQTEISLSLNRITNLTKLKPNKVVVKKLKSSWGRCSSKGMISMNMELAKYEREVIDYVMLHEICHLKYLNHSKDFWNLVQYYMPDYKKKMEILKDRR